MIRHKRPITNHLQEEPPNVTESAYSRRCFLRGAAAAGAAASLPALVSRASAAEGKTASSPSGPAVAAIYCPLWHRYDHMDAWHGYGWCEWELVKSAPARFPGHYQPLRPAWGFFDESDPKWSQREIDLAAEHNIDVFLFDWYWYSGVRLMEEALEGGFLKAPNRNRLKFALIVVRVIHDFAIWVSRVRDPVHRIVRELCSPGSSVGSRVLLYCS